MTGGTKIRAVGPEDAQDAHFAATSEEVDAPLALEDEFDEAWDYEDTAPRSRGWIAPILAISAAAGWTIFYGWAHQSDILQGGTPQQWSGWIIAWSVPVLLIVSVWLLAVRNSRSEAKKFGAIANTLSHESALLESRLTTVNRELSLAREFLSSQSRELDSVGRVASERLSQHAERLQSLVALNADQIDSIADVSTKALENMDRLRDDLPVIANSARDVSNQIGTAGQAANEQIGALTLGCEQLGSLGKTNEAQVEAIRLKIDELLAEFEQRTAHMEDVTESRFAALREASETYRTELDCREVDTLAAMRRRAGALAEEFAASRSALETEEEEALRSLRARLSAIREEAGTVSLAVQDGETKALALWQERIATLKQQLTSAIAEVERIDKKALEAANTKLFALRDEAQAIDANLAERDARLAKQLTDRRAELAASEEQALAKFTQQLAELDEVLETRREAQFSQADILSDRSEAVAARMASLKHSIEDIAAISDAATVSLSTNADALEDRLAISKDTLAATDIAVSELTEATVRLLELIQASVQHSENNLPEALSTAEARLTQVRDQAADLRSIVSDAETKSQDVSSYVLQTSQTVQASIAEVDAMRGKIDTANALTAETISELTAGLAGLNEQSDLLSRKAQEQLRDAITALEEAARNAPATIEMGVRESVLSLAANVGKETGEVLDRTLNESAKESIARLEEASRHAANSGRDTAIQLRDQLSKVNELAGNLETRVAYAREQAEEQVGNDFARRMALITESLNSNAIDLSKALDTEVTDIAWASYLRGDRGIFTRRAVRLIDNTEARDIAEIYDEDLEFRENVSRYIHDFESMLRSMLSTRDGNALGVTLLSSDMGKLYVALAQAIQRLRE
ncbi:ATPase [Pontixanthobacter sp.]|uniref:ATPase n=1 Tax=Pontixanthobacter sp. TaxID=2792078 RepID=UPI003C7A16D7